MTARMAAAVDDLSGGRLMLGLGAGWQQREHTNYGLELLDLRQRFDRFGEGLHIISQLLHEDRALEFSGQHFRLKEARLLPRPQRPKGPPIMIGGNGPLRTLPLAARYADEWNGLFLNVDGFGRANDRLNDLLDHEGRDRASVRRSVTTIALLASGARDMATRIEKAGAAAPPGTVWNETLRAIDGRTSAQLRDEEGWLAGDADAISEQLQRLSEAGVDGVIVQWLDQEDLDGLEELAAAILPSDKEAGV